MIKAIKKTSTIRKKLEPTNENISKIRAIGNSNGIILSNKILQAAGFSEKTNVTLSVKKGQIIIHEQKENNTPNVHLATWEAQFKQAKKNGAKPDNNLLEGITNNFDENEWL